MSVVRVTDLTATTSLTDDDLFMVVDSPGSSPASKKITAANIKAFTSVGVDNYHGIESIGTISFDNSTHVLTLSAVTYWYKGTQYTTASAVTCDLDLTADKDHASATLTANTLYYIRFKDSTGKLYWSPSFWDLHETVPVATVFWNGSAGAVSKEAHNYTRNIDWHIWSHLTIGARYGTGLEKTYPTTSVDGSLQIEAGTIYDEDLQISIGQQTTMRGWYQASTGVYTFADYSIPYLGTTGAPVYLDTDTYALTTFASNKYICYWVFATADQGRPIAIIPSHVSTPYSQAADARAELQPAISGVNPEWKLIYRWIYSGDGQFVESADYRLQTSIAGGVSASTNAGAVAFTPSGNIAATNVQAAIEELDSEKTSYTDAMARSAVIASSISDGDTTHSPDGNSVYDALALKAPLSSPTFTNTPAAPTAADNTATTQLATTAFAKSQDAVLARLPDQAVNMTYAASGSSGIAVADNDNIDFGIGNFTLVWRGSLPNWSINTTFINKDDGSNGYILYIADSQLRFYCRTSSIYVVGSYPSFVNNTTHEITVSITRETTTSNGTVNIYADGLLILGPYTINSETPQTVSNAVQLFFLGTSAERTAGTCSFAATFNRALSAAEVLDLYRNGINYADKWGAQGILSSDTAWTGSTGSTPPTGWSVWNQGTYTIFDSGDGAPYNACLKLITTAGSPTLCSCTKNITTIIGKKYRFRYSVKHGTGTCVNIRLQQAAGGTAYFEANYTDAKWTNYYYDFFALTTTTTIWLQATCSAAGQYELVDEVYLTEAPGCTLALEPEGIQPSPGQWLDSSTNKLHAMQPATGSSLTRKKDTFEVRWTNTWAGTHEAQYIGGANQAVLPVGGYIESIIGVITGSTINDIIIGDGSDTDRWVTITSNIAVGTISFTLANRISDGTNYKLVVDPDANFTGSIAFTITGRILQ